MAAPKGAFLCLGILATRKRVDKLFQAHQIRNLILFQLPFDVFLYLPFVSSYRIDIWALYIRKTGKQNCFRLGTQPAAPVTIVELSSIYSAIRRNSSAYLNFTLMLPPS